MSTQNLIGVIRDMTGPNLKKIETEMLDFVERRRMQRLKLMVLLFVMYDV